LSIDDFGTGYSSLSYLKRMPLYELKIDRSFIRDTPSDANGTAIVQSILAMAGHLGLRVIAEGVETQEQAHFLAQNGAQSMQGYLFARPMPIDDVIDMLGAWSANAALASSDDHLYTTPQA
jgi:EAL domain-containing protein (putative c-di-GMP-specific phosphodiesterase class I)